jgi:hypothetical protein
LPFECNLQRYIVASAKDRIFPSIAEARRLMAHVPRCKLHVAPHSGHAVLLEEETCLAQIISDARYLPPKPVVGMYKLTHKLETAWFQPLNP